MFFLFYICVAHDINYDMIDDKENTDPLKLSNQVCFPIYSVSRLITRAYQPYLKEIGLTYPQYLVMMVLWEEDHLSINHISERLLLNTNTLSPLLQRMESQEFIHRNRCNEDERSVIICLSNQGRKLKEKAASVPTDVLALLTTENINLSEIQHLKGVLENWMQVLIKKQNN